MKNYYLLLIVLFVVVSTTFAQVNTIFETFSFTAEIDDSQLLNAEISSCMDQSDNTHIAWIKSVGTAHSLMYTIFDKATEQFTTVEVYTGDTIEIKIAPYIVLDDNDNPHIAYIIKRDPGAGTKEGNYAVMYAGDSDGNGTFDILQVSTNPTDPNDGTDGIYHSYVNGRPSVVLSGTDIIVTYIAQSSSLTNWDKYIIFATQNGSSWNLSQEILTDNLGGTFPVDRSFSFPRTMSSQMHGGFVEISNYNPRFVYKNGSVWTEVQISGYSNAEHIQLEVDSNGLLHYFWLDEGSTDKFCHTTITGGTYTPVEEMTFTNNKTGNHFPATIDMTTGDLVYFYDESGGEAWVIMKNNLGQYIETELVNVGRPYGKESINANNNYISVVTASENDQEIYVSTNTGSTSGVNKMEAPEEFIVFPNPTSDFINYQLPKDFVLEPSIISVVDLKGATVLAEEINSDSQLNINKLESGTFILIITNSTKSYRTTFSVH